MKNINNFILNFSRVMLGLTVLITVSSCNTQDDHYEQLDTKLESDLITILSEDENYSSFLSLLEQTGYKDILETSQAYTVWAPNNDAISEIPNDILNDDELLKQLVENHIGRNSHISSNLEEPVFVKMFNNKFIEFANIGGTTTFGNVDLIEKDILTSNGIFHGIGTTLKVKSNIWEFLNDNSGDFPILMEYLNQFNETVFDETNSVKTGTNTLGQAVFDSIFKTSNTKFDSIGDLSSEAERYTFIGLTDAVYDDVFDVLKDFYQHPVDDSIKDITDKVIFSNLNFPLVASNDLNGEPVLTTSGNPIVINSTNIIKEEDLSNGNLFVMDQYDLEPRNVIYKPIRYEIENTERREVGSLSDFTIASRFNRFASGEFTNVVTLSTPKDFFNRNNHFTIAFENVLTASYNVRIKFSNIGAEKQTKLKFELSYVDADKKIITNKIDPIIVSHLEDGIVTIGDTYDIPVYINEENDNEFFVKLKVFLDVNSAEEILYNKRFGIDYAELVPVPLD